MVSTYSLWCGVHTILLWHIFIEQTSAILLQRASPAHPHRQLHFVGLDSIRTILNNHPHNGHFQ